MDDSGRRFKSDLLGVKPSEPADGRRPQVRAVDINCDVGESETVLETRRDLSLLRYVTSANIACGFHAGGPSIMAATVSSCSKLGVGMGAHPSFPDRAGFGRRKIELGEDELYRTLVYQVGALDAIAHSLRASIYHLKAHGALYNMACKRRDYADAIVKCAKITGKAVLAPADSMVEVSARASRVKFAAEGFVDRGYLSDGTLAPRGSRGALILDPAVAAKRAIMMLDGSPVDTIDGGRLVVRVQSLCVHSDTPGAPLIVRAVARGLKSAGFLPKPLMEIL